MMDSVLQIAIDGPSGAGKSTIARACAKALQMEYIDTGAMYRAVGYGMVVRGITCAPEDREALTAFLDGATVNFHNGHVCLNGEDIADRIRTPEISKMASDCSALPEVRAKLVEEQRLMGQSQSVVMDGRDIGTNVFPQAPYKFFLTASAEERANRRYLELKAKAEADRAAGKEAVLPSRDEILADMKQRDYNDSHRALNPLRKAEDAVEIDSTHMTIEQVVEAVLQRVGEGDVQSR